MFVQIIEGRTADADGMRRHTETWRTDLRGSADGFAGVTAGVTDDGRAITLVRFTSAALATANSQRPEQAAWWNEMEKYYDGDVSFSESSDVTPWRGGGTDAAGYVQVMRFATADRATVERMDALIETSEARPDVLGGYRVWTGPTTCVEVVYFTNEAEAREGEKAGMPPEFSEIMGDFESMMADVEYFDLRDPQLF